MSELHVGDKLHWMIELSWPPRLAARYGDCIAPRCAKMCQDAPKYAKNTVHLGRHPRDIKTSTTCTGPGNFLLSLIDCMIRFMI